MDDVRSDEIVPATSRANAPKDFQLGVLFVHGIGTQRSRNTVVQWGDELLRIIDLATKGAVKSRVVRAWPGDGSAEKPAEAAVFLRSGKHEETWLLAEGWWADTFPAPTYRELVSWSVRAVPWAITLHIAHRYWERKPHASGREKFLAASVAVLQLLIALALAPLFIALLLLALVVGLLPIAQVRTAILSAQSVLSGTAGDCLAFVESPVRAALIRTRILESLEALARRCDRTVIVAHSQGAAAVLDALGGIADSGMEQEMTVRRQPPKPPPIPDTLLTFGAGINQLVSLKVLSRGLPEKFGGNPAYIGVGSMVTALVLFAWLFEELRTGRTTINAVLQTAGVLIIAFAAIGLVFATVKSWRAKHPRPEQASTRKIDVEAWIIMISAIAIIAIVLYYAKRNDLPFGAVNLLLLAGFMLAASLVLILSPGMRQVITAPVRKPVGLARWVDLYASADPVPNGPTRIEDKKSLTPIPICNRGSFFSDHTTYWQNLDGFTLRVARVCAETAGSSWVGALPPETKAVDERAAWRVRVLRLAVLITRSTWLFVLFLLWSRYGLIIPLPFDLPTWLPFRTSPITQWAIAPILIVAGAWLTSRLLSWAWAIWVSAEQRAVLAHAPTTDTPTAPFVAMGIVVSAVLVLAFALARGDWLAVQQGLTDPRSLLELAPLFLGWGIMLGFLARWRMPAPRPSDVGIE